MAGGPGSYYMNGMGRGSPEDLRSVEGGSGSSGHWLKEIAAIARMWELPLPPCEGSLFSHTSAEQLDMQENSEI